MAIIAGDLLEVAVDHPELGSRVFEPKSGEDFSPMTGGFKSNDDDGNITSTGNRIDQLNRYPWSAEVTIGANPGDLDFLQALTENPLEGNWTFTHISGDVRVGSGKPVGDVQENKQAGTIGFKVAGSGRLELL